MTYKLEPGLSRIISPVALILPDGSKKDFENGNAVVEAVFDKKYAVRAMEAVNSIIYIKLVEQKSPNLNWNGEEATSFF